MELYCTKLTEYAIQQMQETVRYISHTLLEPEVALRWAERIQNAIQSLENMPARYPLVSEDPWREEGVRWMPVEHFVVYYWIEEEQKNVWVLAIVYGRRDQLPALRDVPPAVR